MPDYPNYAKPTLEERVIETVRVRYDCIAEDIFVNENGRFDPTVIFTGEDLADIMFDAPFNFCDDQEAVQWFCGQTREEQKRIMKATFPDEIYGY
jgi:hypothetical protein